MRLGRRLRRIEKNIGKPSDVVVPIICHGAADEREKARIAAVEAKGWRVHLVRIVRADRGTCSASVGE